MSRYEVRDLAEAMVNAFRYRGAAPELREFHAERARAMRAAFEAEEPAVQDARRFTGLPALLDASVQSLATSPSPFAGFIEATRDVADMYHRHGPAIDAAVEALQAAILSMLVELIHEIYAIPVDHGVDAAALAEHGFDNDRPWPDPLDYL